MEKDITTNDLLENNDVFADIANVNLFAGKQLISATDLEAIPTDTSYKDLDGQHHRLFRDVLKKVNHLNCCIGFIGYESQTNINRVMPVRDMGYTYTGYAKQIKELVAKNNQNNHSAYTKVLHDNQTLVPMVTFILYFGKEEWKTPLSLMDILKIPEEETPFWKNLINDYKIHVISLNGQPKKIRRQYQSDFSVIADYLAYSKNKKQLTQHLRKNNHKLIHVEQVLDLLQALSNDSRFQIIQEKYQNIENKKECDTMCLLLDLCEEDGIRKGVRKGMEDGMHLMQILLQEGKTDEAMKATQDEEYRNTLLKKYLNQ